MNTVDENANLPVDGKTAKGKLNGSSFENDAHDNKKSSTQDGGKKEQNSYDEFLNRNENKNKKKKKKRNKKKKNNNSVNVKTDVKTNVKNEIVQNQNQLLSDENTVAVVAPKDVNDKDEERYRDDNERDGDLCERIENETKPHAQSMEEHSTGKKEMSRA